MVQDPRQHSPAAQRNQGPILEVLRRLLPSSGVMLEIASGTGQHAAHFASSLPAWQWHPSDAESAARNSIAAWCQGLGNAHAPVQLDVLDNPWPGVPAQVDAVFCANMLHIAPPACCAGLLAGVARHLAPEGLLFLYGPFVETGVATAASNLAFDADLKRRNPSWGLRALSDVAAVASHHGLLLRERYARPANNLLLVFARS